MGKRLKRIEVINEDVRGVCFWRMPDGSFIGDGYDRYLTVEGYLNDPIVERKMLDAAVHYIGGDALLGEAFWSSGSRKISDNESDDHMERFLDGHIPDPVDAIRQLKRKGLV
jgi:hypothetical protein